MRRLVARKRRSVPPVVTQAASIPWGARITHELYTASPYSITDTNDAPWAIPDAAPNAWTEFIAHAGKTPVFLHWGGPGTTIGTFDATAAADAWNAGLISNYSMSASLAECNDLLNGTNTNSGLTLFDALVTAIKSNGHPMLFRPLWEMNGTWFAWGRTNFTGAQYVTIWQRMWQRAADIMGGHTAGSGLGTDTGNMAFFWCPNDMNGEPDPTSYFPGVTYVDVVGADGYNKNDTNSPAAVFDAVLNVCRAAAPGKPIFIGETGCEAPTTYSGGKTQWVDDFFAYIKAHADIEGFSWFNETGNPVKPYIEVGPLATDFGSTVQTHWASGIADSYFKAGGTSYVNSTNFPSGTKVLFP